MGGWGESRPPERQRRRRDDGASDGGRGVLVPLRVSDAGWGLLGVAVAVLRRGALLRIGRAGVQRGEWGGPIEPPKTGGRRGFGKGLN